MDAIIYYLGREYLVTNVVEEKEAFLGGYTLLDDVGSQASYYATNHVFDKFKCEYFVAIR